MKKLTLALAAATVLISAPALAADLRMPVKAPVVAPPIFSWSGFYIGAHVGGGWGTKDWEFTDVFIGGVAVPLVPPLPATSHDVSGLLAGGQIGFNWQTGPFVFGVEGEASWADIDGSSTCPNPAASCRSEVRWLASATGRLGYAWDRVLLYAKGGWAFAGDNYFVRFPAAPAFDERSGDITQSGPTIGGGLEWAFTPNWSAKIEYMFASFDRERFDFTRIDTGVLVERARVDQELHTVKFGINYRFGWGGPVY
jgi:outer membrane immunogenic protein